MYSIIGEHNDDNDKQEDEEAHMTRTHDDGLFICKVKLQTEFCGSLLIYFCVGWKPINTYAVEVNLSKKCVDGVCGELEKICRVADPYFNRKDGLNNLSTLLRLQAND